MGLATRADTSDDESLARLEQHVAALRDAHCVDCQRALCGHESLFNVALGLTTKPRCVSCLAAGLAMSAEGLRDHLLAHFPRRDCYGEVWRRVNEREGFLRLGLPACLWPDSGGKCADAAVRPRNQCYAAASPRTMASRLTNTGTPVKWLAAIWCWRSEGAWISYVTGDVEACRTRSRRKRGSARLVPLDRPQTACPIVSEYWIQRKE